MPTFSSRANTSALSARRPSIGIMLMLSVPAAIMTSASPVRMRSAAIDTAFRPDEQNRLIVMPATLVGSPASSTPMRATFIPCSSSGIAQPTITSSTRFGVERRHLRRARSSARARAACRAASCAAHRAAPCRRRCASRRRCRRPAVVSAMAWPLVAQRLAGGERVRDPRLRLLAAQQLHELRPLQLEEPLLVDEAARRRPRRRT